MSSQAEPSKGASNADPNEKVEKMHLPTDTTGGGVKVKVKEQEASPSDKNNLNPQSAGVSEVQVRDDTGARGSGARDLKVPKQMQAPKSSEEKSDVDGVPTRPVSERELRKRDAMQFIQRHQKVRNILAQYCPWLTDERLQLCIELKILFMQHFQDSRLVLYTAVMSFLFGYLRFGFLSLFIIMAVCIQYYRICDRRVKVNFKDDYTRYLSTRKLENDSETVTWLNTFLQQFWYIFEPSLSERITEITDQILSENVPSFVDSMALSEFTLGTKSPRMGFIRSYPKTEEDTVMMDLRLAFSPNDISDLTGREIAACIKPKIALDLKIGKSIASAKMPVLIEDLSFTGNLRVKIKLIDKYPYAKTVGLTFTEKPVFSYILKPLGGDKFGFDIGNIPGLTTFITEQIHNTLGPMMYSPNMYELDIESMMGAAGLNTALGAVEFKLRKGDGFKDGLGGAVDPYVVIKNSADRVIGKSKVAHNTGSPVFNETFYSVLNSFSENLNLEVYDFNDIRSDKLLGSAVLPLATLEAMPVTNDAFVELTLKGKTVGRLNYDMKFHAVVPDSGEEITKVDGPGVLQFTVHQCKELSNDPSKRPTAYAKLIINNKEVYTTRKIKKNNNPSWEESFGTLLPEGKNATLGVQIFTEESEHPFGTANVSLQDLFAATKTGLLWFPLQHAPSGRVRMSVMWKPAQLNNDSISSMALATPIGAIRIHLRSANNLHSKIPGKKCDSYARIMSHNTKQFRTVVIASNVNPFWDEYMYAPVITKHDIFFLQVMNYNSSGEDKLIGQTPINISNFINQGENGALMEYHDPRELTVPLSSTRGIKGNATITFKCDFFPSAITTSLSPDVTPAPKASSTVATDKVNVEVLPESQKTPTAVDNTSTSRGSTSVKTSKPKKISELLMPSEAVNAALDFESGFMGFDIISYKIAKPAQELAIFLDDLPHHIFLSSALNVTGGATLHEYGNTFIRQLEYSQCTFKLLDGDKEVGSKTMLSRDLISKGATKPLEIAFPDGASILVAFRLTPVPVKLEEVEMYENMGEMTVDVIKATDLPAADSNGKSDPFVVFELQGEEVYRTKTHKRTLNPTFNESFEVELPCKQTCNFVANVFDWDFGNKDDHLGSCVIDCKLLQQQQQTNYEIPLDSKQGVLYLRITLSPKWVLRSKRAGNSSLVEGILGQTASIVGMPLKGISTVGNVAVDGVASVANLTNKMRKGISRGFKGIHHEKAK